MNILTFDIEDWYCNCVYTDLNWDKYECRLYEGVDMILEELDRRSLKATMFCLGWIADHHPTIIKKIHDAGHHIGCHSYQHQLLTEFDEKQFVEDTLRSKKALEAIIGEPVDAYRAPAWTVGAGNIWVLEKLAEMGFKYDSSIFPAEHSFGGFPNYGKAEPSIIRLPNGSTIKELPVSTKLLMGQHFVFSGGGYFRFFPLRFITKWAKQLDYNMCYFHTQDFDKGQPNVSKDLPLSRKFKTYYGIKHAFDKFKLFLDEFEFVNVREADKMIDWKERKLV